MPTDYPDLFLANGIDRIDNSQGYTKANTRTACWACNAAKGAKDEWAFYQWVADIHSHLAAKGLLSSRQDKFLA
jgi:hypothetical protein